VGASINDQPVSFASPGNPNPKLRDTRSRAENRPDLWRQRGQPESQQHGKSGKQRTEFAYIGLDYGVGDIQGADVAATGLARGDRPEDIAARYAAGLKNTGGAALLLRFSRADEMGCGITAIRSQPMTLPSPMPNKRSSSSGLKGQIGQG
jgi:hypothetical protein